MTRSKRGERPKPGLRLETLIHLDGDVYVERADGLCYAVYHGGFRADGSPRNIGWCGSLREVAIVAGRYIALENLAGVTSLGEAETKLAAALARLLDAAAQQTPRLPLAGSDTDLAPWLDTA